MVQKKTAIYFKGLTELRAIAAIAVIFHHIELYKFRQGESSLFNVRFIRRFIEGLGENGVFLFFVLSGFLITYLLLEEKSNSGNISVRKFYIRRILRIWPLYYIIIGISFFIIPLTLNHVFWSNETYFQELISKLQYGNNLALFLFFFSNLALLVFVPVVGASQSWSVSIEEQFYFFWPILVKAFHKHILIFLLALALLKPFSLFVLNIILKSASSNTKIALMFLNGMKIEYMALGGILAYVLLNKKHLADFIFSSGKLFITLFILLFVSLFFNKYPYLNALLFTFLIGFVIYSNLESGFLKKIGEVSFGIYMYHPLVMYLSFSIIHNIFRNFNSFWALSLEYLLIFLITYLISLISYKYIESYFLKLKSKFTIVKSQIK